MTGRRDHIALAAALIVGLALHAAPAPAQSVGAATTYSVTVQKVELCTDSTCSTASVLGQTSKSFDIASVTVGAAVGQYASTNNLPSGTTFTHVRITMSRTISIAGTVAGVAGLGTCGTDAADASSSPTAAGVGIVGGGGTAQNLVVPNTGVFGGQPTAGQFAAQGITLVDNNTFTFLKALSSPITIGATPPTIDVSFSTAQALGAFNNGGACGMFPQPPSVTMTIK